MRPSQYLDITATHGPRPILLLDLINDWADRVLKFHLDIKNGVEFEAANAWSIHDLEGSYFARDSIEKAARVSLPVNTKLPILAAADELLLFITVADDTNVMKHFDRPENANWWWHRIPTEGPVANDIRIAQERHDW